MELVGSSQTLHLMTLEASNNEDPSISGIHRRLMLGLIFHSERKFLHLNVIPISVPRLNLVYPVFVTL